MEVESGVSSEDILNLPAPESGVVRLPYGKSKFQFGDLRLPAAGEYTLQPVVIAVHGGYYRARYGLEYLGHVAAALTAVGFATWNIEYRRLGYRGGGWPGTFADVAAAADYLNALAAVYPLDLTRVVAIGHSAGGHLACWLAARHRISAQQPLHSDRPMPIGGAVALAGVLDLRRAWELRLSHGIVRRLLGGTPEQVPERYDAASPLSLLPLGVPQILVHGTADSSVPFEISERYAAAALEKGDEVQLVALPGAGHFEIVDPRTPEWQSVLQSVRKVAK
jgi:acetyl esterase/lipase